MGVLVLMTRCPTTGRAVSTGISTRSVHVESLPDIDIRLQCTACGGVHHWRKRDAWLAHNSTAVQPEDSAA